jgi:hypothetical protein
MDLTKYNYEEVNPCMDTDKALLTEAISRGFYNGHTKYNDLFTEVFFKGGKLNFKENLDPLAQDTMFNYLKYFMKSFSPKHEEKEAICAMLLSELVD